MSMEALVFAWRWGYDEGRRDAREHCGCTAAEDPGNVVHLDDRRPINQCRQNTN